MSNKQQPNWCKFKPKHRQNDPHFEKIIDFYLWSCPVEKTAYGAKVFKDLGWRGGNQFKALKKRLLETSDEVIPYIAVSNTELLEVLNQYNQATSCSLKEVVIIVNPQNQKIRALFRAIRNALAHGSFKLRKENKTDDYYYFFENRDPKNNEIRARVVLKSSTLKSWIKIVESGFKLT